MTVKERAVEAFKLWANTAKTDIETHIEQAIIAAVAEDRESRECCKAAYEECESIAAKYHDCGDPNCPDRRPCLNIAEQIRARAERDAG